MLRAGKLGGHWRRMCPIGPVRNMPIVTVALDRLPPSFTNGVFKRGDSLLLRCSSTGHVKNFFLQDCPVEIVHAVAQRDLREAIRD